MTESQSQLLCFDCVSDETDTRDFNSKVLNVKLHTAMRGIYGKFQGGVLFHNDADYKNRPLVLEVPREKHPDLRTPGPTNPACNSFKEYT